MKSLKCWNVLFGGPEFTFAGRGSSSLSQEQIIFYIREVEPVCIDNKILIISP